jgi:HD-GYP domain-containing protein (c-di-GMP phosphodiesterase class II)
MRDDLNAWDGTVIVQQGEIITPETVKEIQDKGHSRKTKSMLLKECGFLEGFKEVMNEESYRVIFDHNGAHSKVLDVVGQIHLTSDICQELRIFKAIDYYTYRHILITTALSTLMARDLFQDPQQVTLAASTALTHDFGKSRIPLRVLKSSKKLNSLDYLYILEHPWIGFLLLTYYTSASYSVSSQVAFNHHEKIDGSGYPRGVHVHDTIIQLVTICDIFDALISPRTYRKIPFNTRGALDLLCDEAESGKLNMTGVKLMISYNRTNRPSVGSVTYSRKHSGYCPPDEKNNYSSHEDYQETDLDNRFNSGN